MQTLLLVQINGSSGESVHLGENERVIKVVGRARVAQDGHDLLLQLPLVLRRRVLRQLIL